MRGGDKTPKPTSSHAKRSLQDHSKEEINTLEVDICLIDLKIVFT